MTVSGTLMRVIELFGEVLIGIWLLVLFSLAMIWDPFDRRLAHRRRPGSFRPNDTSQRLEHGGAYAIIPRDTPDHGDEDSMDSSSPGHLQVRGGSMRETMAA